MQNKNPRVALSRCRKPQRITWNSKQSTDLSQQFPLVSKIIITQKSQRMPSHTNFWHAVTFNKKLWNTENLSTTKEKITQKNWAAHLAALLFVPTKTFRSCAFSDASRWNMSFVFSFPHCKLNRTHLQTSKPTRRPYDISSKKRIWKDELLYV